jgi:hypothetical protein
VPARSEATRAGAKASPATPLPELPPQVPHLFPLVGSQHRSKGQSLIDALHLRCVAGVGEFPHFLLDPRPVGLLRLQ